MSANSPGDNIVANEMIRFFSEAHFGGGRMSFGNAYEDLIGRIGTDVQQSVDERDASNLVLAQIKSNKESISGVSLDEEAQNMMKYQNAFNASSKLITTADEMMQTVLDLKR
jgi:flagellar hook-associated protein 1 FlgK